MIARLRVLASGHVVELDQPNRDPRLVGKLSWLGGPPDSPVVAVQEARSWPPLGSSPGWGELVANCGCEDCQAQRAANGN